MAQGYKDFTAGAILTAADLEDYNQNQSIMRFANAAARDSALTTVKVEGMMAYLIDVNTVTVYSGSAWSTIGPVHGALTVWTPAITQSGALTSTANDASYIRIGRWIEFSTVVTVTSAGSAGTVITLSLPVATKAGYGIYSLLGEGYLEDTTGATQGYYGGLRWASTTTVKIIAGIAPVAGSYLGNTGFTGALANGDIISYSGRYEAASDA